MPSSLTRGGSPDMTFSGSHLSRAVLLSNHLVAGVDPTDQKCRRYCASPSPVHLSHGQLISPTQPWRLVSENLEYAVLDASVQLNFFFSTSPSAFVPHLPQPRMIASGKPHWPSAQISVPAVDASLTATSALSPRAHLRGGWACLDLSKLIRFALDADGVTCFKPHCTSGCSHASCRIDSRPTCRCVSLQAAKWVMTFWKRESKDFSVGHQVV